MKNSGRKILLSLLLGGMSLCLMAEETRDYYSEPGLHPFKESQGVDQTENIDPFSGNLQLQYTDVHIPGNGGMDIVIHRNYTNPQAKPSYYNVFGIGWSFGYGRIVVPASHVGAMCGIANMGNTQNNPSLEHPDGARELLVYNDLGGTGGDGSLITKSNWKVKCLTSDYRDGLLATSPNGTRYTMNVQSNVLNSQGSLIESSFYTSDVQDVYGNWLSLAYQALPNRGASDQKYLTRITAGTSSTKGGGSRSADGREVTFDYIDENDLPLSAASHDARLGKITSQLNGVPDQIWQYEYEEADIVSQLGNMYGLKFYQLTKVTRPDGTFWRYAYYPEIVALDDADSLALQSVTYPQGGSIAYDYQKVSFYSWTQAQNLKTNSVHTKTTAGPNTTGGVWTYEFAPYSYAPSGFINPVDVTTVYRPDGSREKHYHYGHSYTVGYYDLLWTIGLKFREEIYSASNQLEQLKQFQWEKRQISNQWYIQRVGTTAGPDRATWAPRLYQEHVSRYDGDELGYATRYENYDKFGNPGKVTAPSVISSYSDKVTQTTYYNDETQWIIGKPATETITGVAGNVSRVYDAFGSVTSENRYGIATAFTYTNDGDLASTADARGNTTYFENYYRGIARLERKPVDNIRIVRTVNDSGTVSSYNVTSDSDTRNLTKLFAYDNLNRLSGIDFPTGADVAVGWTGATVQTLTRGNFEEKRYFDGFGRVRQQVRRDTGLATPITVNTDYDEFGRKSFESFPNSPKGIGYTYTALGDPLRISYANGDFRQYQYFDEAQYVVTDGKGNTTQHLDNFFGSPDRDRTPYFTLTPVNATITTHNLLNQPTQIFQGQYDSSTGNVSGFGRAYAYDSHQFLLNETHNELAAVNSTNALVIYARDAVGNMTGKTVGDTAQVGYEYDALNRLTRIDYPNTDDTLFTYSKTDKPKTITHGTATRAYTYDNNDNLTDELVTIGGNNYSVGYAVDSLDAISAITYPSGRTVALSPDALGRPSQVGGYITSIGYHPSGQWQQLVYGNGQTTTQTLDSNRLWVSSISGTGSTLDLTYGYDIVGNVTSIADGITPAANRTLTYDGLNRLVTAQGSWGSEAIGYDARDNITAKGANAHAYNSNLLYYIQSPGNIYKFFEYDPKARTTFEWVYNYAWQFYGYSNYYSYDEADNLTGVQRAINNVPQTELSFGYDGKGNRVYRVQDGGDPVDYVYSEAGLLLGEYPAGAAAQGKEYVYLGSQLIAAVAPDVAPLRAATRTQKQAVTDSTSTAAAVKPDGTPADPATASTLKRSPQPSVKKLPALEARILKVGKQRAGMAPDSKTGAAEINPVLQSQPVRR